MECFTNIPSAYTEEHHDEESTHTHTHTHIFFISPLFAFKIYIKLVFI